MAVEINIDLDSTKAHGKIEALETRLKAVKDNVDLDFDIDDDLKDSIQKLTEELKEIDIDVDYDDLERAAALKAMLQGDIESDLNINSDEALAEIRDGLDPPDVSGDEGGTRFSEQGKRGFDVERFSAEMKKYAGGQPRGDDGRFLSNDFFRRFLTDAKDRDLDGVDVDFDGLKKDLGSGGSVAQNLKSSLGEQGYGKIGDPFGQRSYDSDRLGQMRNRMRTRMWPNFEKMGGMDIDFDRSNMPDIGDWKNIPTDYDGSVFKGMKKKIRSLIPSMSTFYSLFAAILPLMISMGTQALGVAAAMGSVAVAGASILALGLVGHGEDMASSWREAKEQLSTLKKEMFETFQPTMQTFAPIQARFFEMMPEELNKVAKSMEGLTVYSDTLFASFAGLTDFMADFFGLMVANEGAISQLTMRFGDIIGTNILGFFQFLIDEAYESQGMLIRLGGAFKDLLSGAYQFSKIIARVVVALTPLAGLFAWLGRLLNNKIIVGILTFVTVLGLTVYTVMTLSGVMAGLIGLWSGGLIATVLSSVAALEVWIFQTIAAQMANYGLAASIATVVSWATLGVGALVAMGAAASAIGSINSSMEMTTSGIGGGGIPGSGGDGFGGGGAGSGTTQTVINQGDTYNMEVNGDVDNATEQGLRDMISSEGKVTNARKTPTPGSS